MSTRDYTYSKDSSVDGDNEANVGEVWRMKSVRKNDAFSHCTVLGIAEGHLGGHFIRLARPYCYVSGVGTTAPVPLTGCEVFEVSTTLFFERFARVCGANYIT